MTIKFHFISRFRDLKSLSIPERIQVWDLVGTLLQESEKENPDNQVTPELAAKKPALMLAYGLRLMKKKTVLSNV